MLNFPCSAGQLGPILLAMADWAVKDSGQFKHLEESMMP